jgi:signal peptidase II
MPNPFRGVHNQIWLFLVLALAVLFADQLTKLWIIEKLFYGESRSITGFFNLVHVYNYGAAFSFLDNPGGWQRWGLSLLALIIIVMITIWMTKLSQERRLEGLALALILGGALGNLYDRLTLGYVVDFLDFHWLGVHFPAFNVADSAITIGAIVLLWDSLANKPKISTLK